MDNHRNNRHVKQRLKYKAVPRETPWEMGAHRPLRLVWWLRSDGWKEMSVRQYQRILVALYGISKPSYLGNKR